MAQRDRAMMPAIDSTRAVGHRLAFAEDGAGDGDRRDASPRWIPIVSVVKDAKYAALREPPTPQVFFPITGAVNGLTVYVRTGVGLGLIAMGVAGRWMAAQLHGVAPADPWTIGPALLVLAVVMLLAALGPARRAMRLDPAAALRAE